MNKFCSNCALPLVGLGGLRSCPGCHSALTLRGPGTGRWQPVQFEGKGTWQQYHAHQSVATAPWALPSGKDDNADYEGWRRSPARNPEFIGDVVVPACQAALIGLAFSIAAFPWPWILGELPWWFFAPIGLFSFAVASLVLLRENRAHLWNEERVTRKVVLLEELKEKATEAVELDIVHRDVNGKFIRSLGLSLPSGVSREAFCEFSKGVTRRGASLAVKDWTGSDKLFSKKVYNSLLDTLLEAGIVEWKDPKNENAGRILPDAGRVALLAFCEEYEK